MYKAYLQIRSYSRRVRAAGGRVSRGGLPRRRGWLLPARRLPILPHPRAAAAGSAPSLTRPRLAPPFALHTTPHKPLLVHSKVHPSVRAPRHPHRTRLWHTREGRFGRIALSLPSRRW